MTELWKTIPTYPNYMASNLGRIKSIARGVSYIVNGNEVRYSIKERMMSPRKDAGGYLGLRLSRRFVKVHRLVLMAFDRGPTMKEVVHFKDGNKLNCNVDNLCWVKGRTCNKLKVDRKGT